MSVFDNCKYTVLYIYIYIFDRIYLDFLRCVLEATGTEFRALNPLNGKKTGQKTIEQLTKESKVLFLFLLLLLLLSKLSFFFFKQLQETPPESCFFISFFPPP